MQQELQTAIASLEIVKNFLKVIGKALAYDQKQEYKSIFDYCVEELSVIEQSLKNLMEQKDED